MSDDQQEMRLTDLEVDQILGFIISLTSSKALQYLGVNLNGSSTDVDLSKAKVMIDCTSYLVDQITLLVKEEEAQGFKNLVSDLKLRYVKLT
jgi:hypothetical protein